MGALELLWLIAAGSPERLRAARRGLILAALAVKAILFVLFAGYFVYTLVRLQTGDALAGYQRVFLFIWAGFFVVAIIPLPFSRGRGQVRRAVETVGLLRRAAASGDDRLAPRVTGEPASGVDVVMPAGETTIGPLRSLNGAPQVALTAASNITMPLVVGATWAEFDPLFTMRDALIPPYQIGLYGVAFMALVVALYLGIYRIGTRRKALSVGVDAAGLRWSEVGAAHHLAWAEARAFFRVSYASINPQRARTAYVLDGGDTALVWTLAPKMPPGQRAAATQMEQLVAARTPLPLHDLTELVGTLTLTGGSLVRLRALGIPTESLVEAGQPGA